MKEALLSCFGISVVYGREYVQAKFIPKGAGSFLPLFAIALPSTSTSRGDASVERATFDETVNL